MPRSDASTEKPRRQPAPLSKKAAPQAARISSAPISSAVPLVFALALISSSAALRAGQNCPVKGVSTTPLSATHQPALSRSPFPLPHDPDRLRTPEGDLEIRYQQLIGVSALPQPRVVQAIRFRIDESTPLSDVEGEVSYALELRLGHGPSFPELLSPWFDDNLSGDFELGFDGVVTVGPGRAASRNPLDDLRPGDSIEIVLDQPFHFDPAYGGLLLDLRIKGAFGHATPFTFDAAPIVFYEDDDDIDVDIDAPSSDIIVDELSAESAFMVTLDADRLPVAEPYLGGPVVDLVTIGGPIDDGVIRECLGSLLLPRNLAEKLWRQLERARFWAARGRWRHAAGAIEDYRRLVHRLERRGAIDIETAKLLDQLGAEQAFSVGGAEAYFDALSDLGQGGLSVMPQVPFSVEDEISPDLNPGEPSEKFERKLRRVDELIRELLAAEQEGDKDEARRIHRVLLELVRTLQRDAELREELGLDDDAIDFLKEVELFIEDFSVLERIAETTKTILGDGQIDQQDREALEELQGIFKQLHDKLPSDGFLAFLIDALALPPIRGLGALLDSGDLVSVVWSGELSDGKLEIDIGDDFDIRTLEFLDYDTRSSYGKTNLYLDVHFEKDMTIRWKGERDPELGEILRITIEPEDALLLDLDSSGIFVVWAVESLTGIPDLDDFYLAEALAFDDTLILRGTSNGAKVVIEIRPGATTVVVDGEQTFPK